MLIDYKKLLSKIKSSVGPRYLPKLHIELTISELFEGISKSKEFYIYIRSLKGQLNKNITWPYLEYNDTVKNKIKETQEKINSLNVLLNKIVEYDNQIYPWKRIVKLCEEIIEIFGSLNSLLNKEKEIAKNISFKREIGSGISSPVESVNHDIAHVSKIIDTLRSIEQYALSQKAELSNNPFLYIKGEAGCGKTHLLCDLFENRISGKQEFDTIMLLGEYFQSKGSIRSQIFNGSNIKKLWYERILEGTRFGEFLQKRRLLFCLNRKGKKNKNRSLIIIDALNDTIYNQEDFWQKNIDTIINDIRKYPNVGLIVTTRTGFETKIFTSQQEKKFIHTTHYGLELKTWEAVNKFFHEFNLPLPQIPLLMPEFQNPLFLLLFCVAFGDKTINLEEKSPKQKDSKKPFIGHSGSTHIFEAFIIFSGDKLCSDLSIDRLHFKSGGKRIRDTLIKDIAENLVNNNLETINEQDLIDIIIKYDFKVSIPTFIKGLETNNILLRGSTYGNDRKVNGYAYRFPFQKFSDFLLTRYIFKNYREFIKEKKLRKNKTSLSAFLSPKTDIGKFLLNGWKYGILQALSVECPEQMDGIEFFEVASYLEPHFDVYLYKAYMQSLIWRLKDSFQPLSKDSRKILNNRMNDHDELCWDYLNVLITVAPITDHPFNGNKLHNILSSTTMQDRDSRRSSEFIYENYGEHGALDRILQWSYSTYNKDHIDEEAIFLTLIALSRLLTTPNRIVRDKATKGIVCLLRKNIKLCINLLHKFQDVDDVYILERLYGAIYGVLLFQGKGDNVEEISELGLYIYENIFKNDFPIPHILLRDYASNSIKHIINILGINLKIDIKKISSLYYSDISIIENIPSKEQLKELYYSDKLNEEQQKGIRNIRHSVMEGGDFERYIIGTNSHNFYWKGRKFTDIRRTDIHIKFQESLTKSQKKLYSKISVISILDIIKRSSPSVEKIKIKLPDPKELTIADINNISKLVKEKELKETTEMYKNIILFKQSLDSSQLSIFEKEIEPYISDSGKFEDPDNKFDLNLAKNWIFNRVMELGYSADLHGTYDDNFSRYYRQSDTKGERIGKKYQWIAYHEFLARISDHYEFSEHRRRDDIKESFYKGAWNPHIRDIDFTFLIQNDDHIHNFLQLNNQITQLETYEFPKILGSEWIKNLDDIHVIENLINIIDDQDQEWLLLEGLYERQEDTPPEHKKYDIPIKQIWYIIKGYIIKKSDSNKFDPRFFKQHFRGNWMPTSNSFYEIFLGEYPNSEAFEDIRGNHNIEVNIEGYNKQDGEIDVKVIVADDAYNGESAGADNETGSVSLKLPSKWIINKMDLVHKDLNGIFYNKNGEIVSFCSSIFKKLNPSGLFINKKLFKDFLEKEGYSIYWTLTGEKLMIGGHSTDYTGRLEISGTYKLSDRGNIEGNLKYMNR